jgi:cell division septation protein DedD
MHDDIRARSRRAIVLFIGCVTLAFAMFTLGLLIGRWSRAIEPQAGSVEATRSRATPRDDVALPESPREEPAAYLIRAGSFSSAAEAEEFIVRLKALGFDQAFARTSSAPGGTPAVEVVLGPFPDAEAAAHTMRELRNNGVSDLHLLPAR